MEQKWSIRAYREGDEEAIFELWKAVRPWMQRSREQWMRWWNWMYKENPVGAGRIWLAEHNGKIAGHYALIFMMLKVGNQTVKASQNIDLMTHPDYRRQGIFSKLERYALDEAWREGVHITIGFPNEVAYPGHIKSGWFDVAIAQTFSKPLNWANTLKPRISNKFLLKLGIIGAKVLAKMLYRTRKAPVVEGLTINQVPYFDERINDFWDRVSSHYNIMVVRNKDYLNWRYVKVPDAKYTIYLAEKDGGIYGHLVLRCVQRNGIKVGTIFDILAQSEGIAQCLISRALEHCNQEKVDFISCRMIANKARLKVFRKSGFMSRPFTKGWRFCAYSSSPHISKEFLKDPKNWLVQLGDSDSI